MRKKTHPEKEDAKSIIVLDEGINDLIQMPICCNVGWYFPYKPIG